jgi:hypothetical protein
MTKSITTITKQHKQHNTKNKKKIQDQKQVNTRSKLTRKAKRDINYNEITKTSKLSPSTLADDFDVGGRNTIGDQDKNSCLSTFRNESQQISRIRKPYPFWQTDPIKRFWTAKSYRYH